MSHISDLLSRIKQAEQKKGVPPGLTAAIDSSKRRSSGSRRAVLLGCSVAFAIALGIFTLYAAVSLKDKPQDPQAVPAGQPDSFAAVATIKDRPDSPVVKQNAASSARQEKNKTLSAQAAEKAAVAPIEKAAPVPAGAASDMRASDKSREEPARDVRARAEEQDNSGSRADKIAHELYLASNYERAGDDASAIASYRKVIELDPGNYKAMNNIASLLLKAGSTAEAMPYLKESLRVQGSYVPVLVNMGIALAREGALPEAEMHFSKALAIEPASEAALMNMAVLCENSGRKELAREYYERLRSFGHPQGAAGLNRLR
jgi:tetratricopeptide (TPR) repeat protein